MLMVHDSSKTTCNGGVLNLFPRRKHGGGGGGGDSGGDGDISGGVVFSITETAGTYSNAVAVRPTVRFGAYASGIAAAM